MTKDLQEQLGSCIVTDSIDELCDSINKIGPYVSNMAIGNPMSVNQLKLYSDVPTRQCMRKKENSRNSMEVIAENIIAQFT